MRKKIVALFMATLMATTLFAGCGKGAADEVLSEEVSQDTAVAESSVEDTQTEEANVSDEETSTLISETPVELTIFRTVNNLVFDGEAPVWQEVGKRTNVYLKGVVSENNSSESDAYNLMVASGELADLICYKNMSEMEKLGMDSGLIPLNDLIKEYAPNIQNLLDSDIKFKNAATAYNGNIYQVPYSADGFFQECWWIRQDWLDKLNLEVPTTVDELYDVLTAFKTQDPNGNGLQDEVPLFDRAGHKMPEEYLYLWDTSTGFYPRDGVMTFEPLTENFKIGVENMAKWYQEGLIDQEIFTRGSKARDTLFGENLSGVTHDWNSVSDYNAKLADTIPGFKMVAFAPPANQDGVVRERTSASPTVGTGISVNCKDPVTAIKFIDYLCTQEGAKLTQCGFEDDTYVITDGEISYTDKAVKSELGLVGYLRSIGAQFALAGKKAQGAEKSAYTNPEVIAAYELYSSNPQWYETNLPPYSDGELDLKYSDEVSAEYQLLMSSIKPYVEETFQSWILGTAKFDDSSYEEFVKELKARGIDRAIEINQEAYDMYLNN